MMPILLRNLIGTWLICGFWDWILYYSPLAASFKPYKIIEDYPTFRQMKHDAFWTTSATCTATMIEVILCHFWAVGALNYDSSLMASPVKSLIWALFLTHIREPHFYSVHRFMHPWRVEGIPDVGKFFYKHFHSLHHKSYNTTAFSGTSMHPVESTCYYSAALLAIPFGCNPVIPVALLIDCGIAAWLGHSGFVFPGTGDFYHNIHHTNFDANYGTPNVPLDWLFGTFAKNEDSVADVWEKSSQVTGKAGNETAVHAADDKSKSD